MPCWGVLWEYLQGEGCNFPRRLSLGAGHNARGTAPHGNNTGTGCNVARGIAVRGGCSGPPSRGRDPGRRRHLRVSPLEGATNPAWERAPAGELRGLHPAGRELAAGSPLPASLPGSQRPVLGGGHPHQLSLPAAWGSHTYRWYSERRLRRQVDIHYVSAGFWLGQRTESLHLLQGQEVGGHRGRGGDGKWGQESWRGWEKRGRALGRK